jgi:pimeloyl-ACP methyl ester carboxylesterase
MKRLLRFGCWVYDRILSLHDESLRMQYGEEMSRLFREQLRDASQAGGRAVAGVLGSVAYDAVLLIGPAHLERLRLVGASTLAASAIALGFFAGFCSNAEIPLMHGCSKAEISQASAGTNPAPAGHMVPIAGGHKMFLECSGGSHKGPTVILATGRGLGNSGAWSQVQSRVEGFASVCSFDPLGAGQSDHVSGAHPLNEVVDNMHDLFHTAQLQGPYVLVGASAGGILIRRYAERYPGDVAGFVFVDSAHEEQEWRDAAISPGFDSEWNNPKFLEDNGFLSPGQRLRWHDDVPLIVLERTDLPPCEAFPGLTQQQCDQINAAWHDFQVDLSHRSKYGELRAVAGSGHAMHQQKPEAISKAIGDVEREILGGRS